ncbi:monovalent cation:proton antiporter-2 (CPA2) family protein [Agrobacterium salinitolerans]|uniref:Monovalent cation:proton antiporter-2 (CPA2) family protein n=1 Tax=Agrobacterium salinitolerans TaxID=1183413 RepID=A0A1S9EZ54_9HYPH|nr:monovalent cation:proton antiporter-2 (CPA2) family protein [Agrobacterium salinitolerans]PNQ24589.1 potassium transporter [Rhizobium sp. YIC5082]MCZ7936538.1 monovalent cation:proton antiporter-2 (CPA2) family protein [Agrobacterium salinitolerans]OOO26406.1 potassium transporter [Agrobacterium salinitolerans]QXC51979.1 monovalent cation:proton antiporter-2 (CPA2) family protein [Agrobacterium salinitolerans]UYZ08756.1 monovalent cation:proton antiporter-2 (CPA2) family protein [Agrobacter
MAVEANGNDLAQVVVLLAAGVIAAPIFKRIGLGSVLGYLAAGLVIGPYGLGFFSDSQAILHIAELGVVMFLFIIGLEMQPSRLWSMRQDIFGLGALQVLVCMAGLTLIGVGLGFPVIMSFVAGTGFVLTSTAIVMQMLQERNSMSSLKGQRIIAILLFEDLAIVPLLALVAFLGSGGEHVTASERWASVGIALAAVGALILAGRYLLNPFFRLLAASGAREVMTAAALLVVLGSALLMQVSGLSMAMGAFLAGVLLSESSFRHQLEADIEPFRGILLGLFFLGVGMAIDLAVIASSWQLVVISVVGYMLLKAFLIYGVARALGTTRRESLERAVLMAQGGEFAFVLYSAAVSAGILDREANAILTATIIISMVLTPLMVILHDRLVPAAVPNTDDLDVPENVEGSILLIGFGRFGQIVSQPLLARGYTLSLIDKDADFVRDAAEFGFKVYYGDGSRAEILHAAGASTARAVLICVDDKEAAVRIAEIVKHEFPLVPVLARAYDRGHAIDLLKAGVDYQIRETLESALNFSEEVLGAMGEEREDAARLVEEFRDRDEERFAMEVVGGIYAGRSLIRGNAQPADLVAARTARERAEREKAEAAEE